MTRLLAAIAVAFLFFACAASAQPKHCTWPPLNATPLNLSFSQGNVGSAPSAWILGQSYMPPHAPAYEASVAAANQCHGSPQCATVHSLGIAPPPPIPIGFLFQNLDASPFLGQTLVYRAMVRVDSSFGGVGRLLVRVHRKDCSTTFRDDMGEHPVISGEWKAYEIRAPIALDGYQIEFGVQLVGTGAVWIDQSTVEFKSAPSK